MLSHNLAVNLDGIYIRELCLFKDDYLVNILLLYGMS